MVQLVVFRYIVCIHRNMSAKNECIAYKYSNDNLPNHLKWPASSPPSLFCVRRTNTAITAVASNSGSFLCNQLHIRYTKIYNQKSITKNPINMKLHTITNETCYIHLALRPNTAPLRIYIFVMKLKKKIRIVPKCYWHQYRSLVSSFSCSFLFRYFSAYDYWIRESPTALKLSIAVSIECPPNQRCRAVGVDCRNRCNLRLSFFHIEHIIGLCSLCAV